MKIYAKHLILILNSISIIMQLLAHLFAIYGLQWFGVIPGHAPSMAAFNIGFYFPMVFGSIIISFAVYIVSIVKWKKINLFYRLFGTIPGILIISFFLLNLFYVLREH